MNKVTPRDTRASLLIELTNPVSWQYVKKKLKPHICSEEENQIQDNGAGSLSLGPNLIFLINFLKPKGVDVLLEGMSQKGKAKGEMKWPDIDINARQIE